MRKRDTEEEPRRNRTSGLHVTAAEGETDEEEHLDYACTVLAV